MKENILVGDGHKIIELPKKIWEQHTAHAAQDLADVLSFMTEDHHRIRYFVVRELPRIGKPIPPELISDELQLSLSDTVKILEDLERNLFFLVRNERGEVAWAFPVTADKTPHHLTFSTGERLNAA